MLSHLDPASALALGLLIFALIMVIAFEATNGFHDAANAVATVIYTKSLRPGQAVVLSGVMNFVGVLVGGIAVAYTLVELLPAEVLSPPDGGPAVAMLVSLFVAALSWNIGTWWFGRLAHRRGARQCFGTFAQHRGRRTLGGAVESFGGARGVADLGLRIRRCAVLPLPQDAA
jgi:hypothetical protein